MAAPSNPRAELATSLAEAGSAHHRAFAHALLFVGLGVAGPLAAQERPGLAEPRKSQPASVTQVVGPTKIEILYSRPVARGRELFGALVPWGKVWTPGADTATRITVSTDVRVNGKPLAAGSYSVWTIPGPETWTVIFSRALAVWHTSYPGDEQDALRVQLPSRTGSHMETLAFYFPIVDGFAATLHLHWGTVVVPLSIRVD